jgi:hypothetical protein
MTHSSSDNAHKPGFAFAIGVALLFFGKPIIIKWAHDYGTSGVFAGNSATS